MTIVALLFALVFAFIFAKRGCVSDVSKKIEDLSCGDGIDNDGDGTIDRNGGPDGEPPDEKCLVLNEPKEKDNLALRSSAVVGVQGGFFILGDFELDIPQGALSQNTEITIERIPALPSNELSFSDVYNLMPNALALQTPAAMTLRIRPQDPALPIHPWLFTEIDSGEMVPLYSIADLDFTTVRYLIGAINHFSKKGGTDEDAFKRRWHSQLKNGVCYPPYPEGPCPNNYELCHAGTGGNRACQSCLITPTDFCCICPSDFPTNDWPCRDNSGNLIDLIPECKPYEYPIQANSCSEFVSQSPKGPDGETRLGSTFPSTDPKWHWNASNRRQRGNQFCGIPTIRDVQINLLLTTHYPRWNLASSCQSEWDQFMKKLREHEKGHGDIAKRLSEQLKRDMESQTWPEICASTTSKLDQNVQAQIKRDSAKLTTQFEERLQTEWKTYDTVTDNGANQEATLDCSRCSQ